jgi:hypothetical protein
MNQIELKNQIDVIAWGPRGTQELREAASHPSPVVACVGAFNHFKGRTDRNEQETEILRHACRLIRTNHWFGLVAEAVEVEANLPLPAYFEPGIVGAGMPATHVGPWPPVATDDDVIDLPINLSDQG